MGVTPEVFYDAKRVAILPMGFCYPGTGSSGDLPPRPECARAWRQALMEKLEAIELTLVIGQYAQQYHLPHERRSLTTAVTDWRRTLPAALLLPHPSPRNNVWLKRNPWFEREVVPELRTRVAQVLA
jgi:uracil-DNA glycosylase